MLTDEQIQQYREEGFLVFEALIQGERLAYYKQVFDELVADGSKLSEEIPHWSFEKDDHGEPMVGYLHKIQGVCVVDDRALELAREPEILNRVEVLIGKDLDVFGTSFFRSCPMAARQRAKHQDNYYFGTDTDRIVSCGIYLEDANVENGCLRVVPGSHLMGKIVEHRSKINRHGSWTKVDEAQAVDLVIPAGTAVLFSANLLHGAYDNHSDRTRYSTAWHYLPEELNPERFQKGTYEDRHVARKV